MTVRTRFAPSPTGHLHVGGARTALFAWLHARHHGGEFVLRIEDTDRERSTQESVDAILAGLAWLGLDYDVGPVYQTQRLARYQEIAETLLRTGHAYYCYCTRERLDTLRAGQMERKEKPRYDGRCRNLAQVPPAGSNPVLRFRSPQEGEVHVADLIRGTVSFRNDELDDLVLVRPGGLPTYNFCVVVDDLDMGISCVIRGDDHLNNTPRQINILRALDAPLPEYAHVPMILGSDGKRLSKRHGDVSVLEYRDRGYPPDALLNYLVRLGWSHGDQEIFSRAELVEHFDVRNVNRAASVFNSDKLDWLSQHYLKTSDPQVLAPALAEQLRKLELDPRAGPALTEVVLALRERSHTLQEMADKAAVFYRPEITLLAPAADKHLRAEMAAPLEMAADALRALPDWTTPEIHGALTAVAAASGIKFGALSQALRVAVTGGDVSPSIDVTLALVGRLRAIARIKQGAAFSAARALTVQRPVP